MVLIEILEEYIDKIKLCKKNNETRYNNTVENILDDLRQKCVDIHDQYNKIFTEIEEIKKKRNNKDCFLYLNDTLIRTSESDYSKRCGTSAYPIRMIHEKYKKFIKINNEINILSKVIYEEGNDEKSVIKQIYEINVDFIEKHGDRFKNFLKPVEIEINKIELAIQKHSTWLGDYNYSEFKSEPYKLLWIFIRNLKDTNNNLLDKERNIEDNFTHNNNIPFIHNISLLKQNIENMLTLMRCTHLENIKNGLKITSKKKIAFLYIVSYFVKIYYGENTNMDKLLEMYAENNNVKDEIIDKNFISNFIKELYSGTKLKNLDFNLCLNKYIDHINNKKCEEYFNKKREKLSEHVYKLMTDNIDNIVEHINLSKKKSYQVINILSNIHFDNLNVITKN